MDVMTKSQRHLNMQHIRGKNSKPEIILRQALWKRVLDTEKIIRDCLVVLISC